MHHRPSVCVFVCVRVCLCFRCYCSFTEHQRRTDEEEYRLLLSAVIVGYADVMMTMMMYGTRIYKAQCVIIIIPLMLQFSCYVFFYFTLFSFTVSCVTFMFRVYPILYVNVVSRSYVLTNTQNASTKNMKQKTDSPKAPVSHALSRIYSKRYRWRLPKG